MQFWFSIWASFHQSHCSWFGVFLNLLIVGVWDFHDPLRQISTLFYVVPISFPKQESCLTLIKRRRQGTSFCSSCGPLWLVYDNCQNLGQDVTNRLEMFLLTTKHSGSQALLQIGILPTTYIENPIYMPLEKK